MKDPKPIRGGLSFLRDFYTDGVIYLDKEKSMYIKLSDPRKDIIIKEEELSKEELDDIL